MGYCPNCGKNSVSYSRQWSGTKGGYYNRKRKHDTVGVCSSCGYTFTPTKRTSDQIAKMTQDAEKGKKILTRKQKTNRTIIIFLIIFILIVLLKSIK